MLKPFFFLIILIRLSKNIPASCQILLCNTYHDNHDFQEIVRHINFEIKTEAMLGKRKASKILDKKNK